MKEVKAFIKERKLDDVTLALSKIGGLTGLSASPCKGFGSKHSAVEGSSMNLADDRTFDSPGIKLEIMCKDDLVDEVIETIVKHVGTGLRGDGKIYVTSLETAVRISTGQQGEDAV